MERYELLIKTSWSKLKKLPKLSVEDIAKVKEPVRMYLYAFYGHLDIMDTYDFDQLSIKINEKNDNLFLMAVYSENIELLKYLESRGLDINYKNKINWNAYICAVKINNIKIMDYLESRGIDIHILDNNGNNAYLDAIKIGDTKLLEYLKNRGIDIHILDKNGNNAYLLAAKYGNTLVMDYLKIKILIFMM